ncbi:hypothetical protein J2T11_003706 [Paenarthrobacter nicotinovorans]|nr:hypothetical protein [Paenarthrobacter nicotinovorans]
MNRGEIAYGREALSAQIHPRASLLTGRQSRRTVKKSIFARRRTEAFQQRSERLAAYINSPKGVEAALAKPATVIYTRKKH